MSPAPPDVCVAVISDLSLDARVWKQVRSLSALGYRVRLIGCRYDIPSTVRREQEGVEVVEVPMGTRARVSLVGRLRTLVTVCREILRTRARVYHAHNVHVAPVAWVAARTRRARLVYDGHELYGEVVRVDDDGVTLAPGTQERLAAKASWLVERAMVRHADGVVTTNGSRARILAERHGRNGIDVLQNVPLPVERVEPLDPGFPPDVPVLLYQGGIYARGRAFRQTIEALRLLDDVHFAILGFGRDADLALVREWSEDAGVADRVRLYPPRPFDELVRTAAAATVGIVPLLPLDINNVYGDTNKLYEYLMAGLPVVASDLPELRATVSAGDPPVGEVFEPTSPESIADAVTRVLADRATYEARRTEARRLALERFNWRVEETALARLYDRLLNTGETR